MTAGQHRKVMAMSAELFPYEGGGPAADEYRRTVVLGLCAQLGYTGLTSRTDITRDMAKVVLDVFTKLESGDFVYDHDTGQVVGADTGEIVRAET